MAPVDCRVAFLQGCLRASHQKPKIDYYCLSPEHTVLLIALQPKEYELLAFLVQRPGRVFSRDELLDAVWNIEFSGGTRTVDVHIRWLRQKIEADPSVPRFFITVRGAGYRFEM